MKPKGSQVLQMLGAKLRIFRLFGIDVYIHLSWLLIFALGSWTMSSSFIGILNKNFPLLFHDSNLVGWVLGMAAVILLFTSVLIHEFGHSLVAKAFGIRVGGITLFLLGGVSMLNDEDMKDKATPLKEFLIVAIGPLTSFVLGLAFLGLYLKIEGARAGQFSTPVFLLCQYLMFINFLLAAFNTIPAFPLDGGRMFFSILKILRVGEKRAYGIAATVGSIISYAMIALGLMIVIGILPMHPLQGIWLVIIGLFLGSAGHAERQEFKKRR